MKYHITVSGMVQGVGYRFFTRNHAQALGINGWVRNLPDGNVEMVCSGDEESLKGFLVRLREGPSFSRVDSIKHQKIENDENYHCFQILD